MYSESHSLCKQFQFILINFNYIGNTVNNRKALPYTLIFLAIDTAIELDAVVLARINEISILSEEEQKQVYMVIDALLRDYKAKRAYSNK